MNSSSGIVPTKPKRPCSIIFLIPSLRGGGAERVLVTILAHLSRTRFRATLAVVNLRDSSFLDELPGNLELIDLNCTRVRYAVWGIMRLIWRRRPDVVFSTLGHLNVAISVVRYFLPRDVRFIARETSVVSAVNDEPHQVPLLNILYKLFYNKFDHVICQSVYMQDDLVQRYSFPQQKISVIPNPVDLERVRNKAGDLSIDCAYDCGVVNFVAVGRISREKGIDRLLDAIAMLEDSSVHLTIVGDGPLSDDLKNRAVSTGLAGRVRFLGFQPNPYPYIAQANALVLSSLYEGFPNVVLEALACGTPVIATPAPGGLCEIVEGIGECEIADEISADALFRAIKRWLAGSRKRVDRSAVDRFRVEKIVDLYQDCIDSQRLS
jgi:glycosyltransferase involved in cell wall biosynthesis